MIRISTHVLDTALGQPARSLGVRLERLDGGGAVTVLGEGVTNDDGRVPSLAPSVELSPGTYRLTFDTGSYLEGGARAAFYPRVDVVFRVEGPAEHLHIPLLLSPFGYCTYRGS